MGLFGKIKYRARLIYNLTRLYLGYGVAFIFFTIWGTLVFLIISVSFWSESFYNAILRGLEKVFNKQK
jgi:hypothetical protein